MTRFEMMGRIVECLQQLSDTSLTKVLSELSGDITDKTLTVITHGTNDTEHLQNSQINSSDLEQAVKELKGLEFLEPHHAS